MEIRLVTEPIDYHALVDSVRNHASGAVVLFLGTVREMSEGRAVSGLHYEAYPAMAEKKLAELAGEAKRRWNLDRVGVIHRCGELGLGDVAVALATASPHRAEAFEAGRWLMDSIKEVVPIWKRERWTEGGADWVHPARANP
ncbi:MAG TPA: molybdenum cofactor biosynthesis protein MoaE [Planctomycetia bacterium]|nr:molybdenum cofactor biosynthesis protein MoaE [Planctomycetia bacterium]